MALVTVLKLAAKYVFATANLSKTSILTKLTKNLVITLITVVYGLGVQL